MSASRNSSLHRLLDEAFEGVTMTPEARDLKEEVRANLLDRVGELERSGADPVAAARTALAELGDVRDLLDGGSDPSAPDREPITPSWTAGTLRHRVRPRPAFVVRTVVLSLGAAGSLAFLVLGATGIITVPVGGLLGLGAAVAIALGVVTADALSQETTTNHPLPAGRAIAFGGATGGVLAAIATAAIAAVRLDGWLGVVAAGLFVAAIALFAWLGATTTNRHKAWVAHATHATMEEIAMTAGISANRFDREPETAARFGIYSAVIWLVSIGTAIALAVTVGWGWFPLALLGGLVTMLVVLARMMFGSRSSRGADRPS